MEVETRLPASPGGPLSSAPRYSPITPRDGTPVSTHSFTANALPDPIPFDTQGDGSDQSAPVDSSSKPTALQDSNGTTSEIKTPSDNRWTKILGDASYDVVNSQHAAPNGQDLSADPFRRATEAISRLDPISDPFEEIDEDDEPRFEGQLPTAMDATSFADNTFTDAAESHPDSQQESIRAFARLEFGDGIFYMNTYQIIIGRDLHAAQRDERRRIRQAERRSSQGSQRGSNPDVESYVDLIRPRRDAVRSAAVSNVSGGIMMDVDEHSSRRRRRRNKSAPSSVSGSRPTSRPFDYNAAAVGNTLAQTARPVDLTNMMPKPDECPLIPIHPPQREDGTAPNHKGISRQHVKIAYNTELGLFEIEVIGMNGCFVDETHLERGERHPLASGTVIQIQSVRFKFVLPNVPDGETGTERTELRSDAISQSGISLDFEDGMGDSKDDDDASEDTTDNEDDRYRELRLAQQAEAALLSADEDDDEDENEDDEVEEIPVRRSHKSKQKSSKSKKASEREAIQNRPKIKLKMSLKKDSKQIEEPEEQEVAPVKRKGPGRPPKNGIMSKREEAELRRKEKEAQKAKKVEEMQVKKEEVEEVEESSSPVDKRKAQKKKKEEQGTAEAEEVEEHQTTAKEVLQSIEAADTGVPSAPAQPAPAPKPPKEKRPPKPPRSPSPVWDESTLTPEQLAKPTHSYVILIHEALSAHPKQQMSLPQIYRAIERKYPYYKLKVQTVGWQSSVRHNLSQHQAFVRIERDGKGWMWGLDPEVSIEREKKRRPSPPPMQQNMYGVGPNGFNQPYQQNGFMRPPNNGQMPPQNPYAVWTTNSQGGRGYGMPNPGPGPRPPYPAGPAGSNGPATYQSPYDSSRNNQQNQTTPGQANLPPHASQIPPSYLNQNRPGQQGPVPQSSMASGHNVPAPTNSTLPGGTQAPRPAGPPTPGGAPGQQASKTPGQTPAFSPPPPPNNPHGIPPHIWTSITRFRTSLRAAFNVPDADAILDQAINKCLGIRPAPGTAFRSFTSEKPIIAACSNMLTKMGWPVAGKIAYAEGKGPMSVTSPGIQQNGAFSRPPSAASNPIDTAPVPSQVPNGQPQQGRPPSASGPRSNQPQMQQPTSGQASAHAHPNGTGQASATVQAPVPARAPVPGQQQPYAPYQVQQTSQGQQTSQSQTTGQTQPVSHVATVQTNAQPPSAAQASIQAPKPVVLPTVQPSAQTPSAQQAPNSLPVPSQKAEVAANGQTEPAKACEGNGSRSPQTQGLKRTRSVEENTKADVASNIEPAAKREKLEQ